MRGTYQLVERIIFIREECHRLSQQRCSMPIVDAILKPVVSQFFSNQYLADADSRKFARIIASRSSH